MAKKRQSVTLCLICCGETTWASDHRIVGATDLPLSAAGRAAVTHAASLMAHDHIATIYHPADEAATETATTFAQKLKAKTRSIAALADPNLGLLEGITEQDFADRYFKRFKQWEEDPLLLSPPEGEQMPAARARLFRTVARLLRRSRGDELAIVLHTLGAGLLRCWLADRAGSDMWRLLERRHVVERYVFGIKMIDWLDAEAQREYSPG